MCLRPSEKQQSQMDEGLFGWTPDEKVRVVRSFSDPLLGMIGRVSLGMKESIPMD